MNGTSNAKSRPINLAVDPSGLRIGTPAITTRGMKEPEMAKVAALIGRALDHVSSEAELKKIRDEVKELSTAFPLYRSRLV